MKQYQLKPDRIERIPLQLPISEHHKDVQLYINLFFVNGYPFLATKSEKLNSVTSHRRKSRSTAQITKVLDMVLDKYDKLGYNVTIVLGDNEFKIAKLKA